MPNKFPWFPFYIIDWLTSPSVLAMSHAEVRGYINLLCHCWQAEDCGLPDNDRALSSLSGLSAPCDGKWQENGRTLTEWELAREVILSKFELRNGRWYNLKLLQLHIEAKEAYATRQKISTAGVNARKNKRSGQTTTDSPTDGITDSSTIGETVSQLGACECVCTSSSEVKAKIQHSADGYNPQLGWDWFLATYPKHRLNANQDCRLWLSIVEDAYVEGVIREKLPLFKRSAEWRRGVIPSARKFLSDRLFVMEPPPEAEGTTPQKSTKAGGYVTSAEWERLYGEKESA